MPQDDAIKPCSVLCSADPENIMPEVAGKTEKTSFIDLISASCVLMNLELVTWSSIFVHFSVISNHNVIVGVKFKVFVHYAVDP